MKGIELAEKYYEVYGAPMLAAQFGSVLELVAVGVAGSGSECFGYDDGLSRDHDFDPGFCIFLPDESKVDRKTAFALERAYAKLPAEFMGVHRPPLNPVGGNRRGVRRMEEFFVEKTGTPDGKLTLAEWFSVPEQSLAEATNGKIFYDPSGEFTRIRQRLSYLPEDVRLKKLAGNLLLMGQTGQYNYERSLLREDTAAAQLSIAEFVKHTLHVSFLLERQYLPYYKWSFRALSRLSTLSSLYQPLEFLLSSGNKPLERKKKAETVASIVSTVVSYLRSQKLSSFDGDTLEAHAHAVNSRIKDSTVRNLHVLFAT